VPPDYPPGLRPIYIYRPSGKLFGANCPIATWVECTANAIKKEGGVVPSTGSPACEFTLEVPPWQPTPNSPRKKEFASKLLREIRDWTGIQDPKVVYVRDFNLLDPDIWIYVISKQDEERFLGCKLDTSVSPGCSWHLFGQSPLDAWRKEIMNKPYRLYPPNTTP
jgi:hypothetical protein